MKILIAIAFGMAAASAAATDSFSSQAAAPTHPALYSFVDVYRLTVPGSAMGGFAVAAGNDSPMRVAVSQGSLAPETQFSVVSMAEPGRWGLLLAGVALALWVARRRLGYFF
jgi:hypothetical protein